MTELIVDSRARPIHACRHRRYIVRAKKEESLDGRLPSRLIFRNLELRVLALSEREHNLHNI